MILEVNAEDIRDIAAAVHSARKLEPGADVLAEVERKVMNAIQRREETLELEDQQAQALRNALLRRAYDQRNTTEALDYSDLAERIGQALDSVTPPLDAEGN
jgi:hypothetical protein